MDKGKIVYEKGVQNTRIWEQKVFNFITDLTSVQHRDFLY